MAKQSFLDRLIGRKKRLDTQYVQAWDTIRGLQYSVRPEHAVLKLVTACNMSEANPLPRQWMKLSRVLYNKLPLYKRGIEIHADLIGGIKLREGLEISDRTYQLCEDFFEDVKILSEMAPEQSDISGINILAAEMVTSTLVDGMCFMEDRFKVSEVGEEMLAEYLGVMLFNAEHFEYAQHPATWNQVLTYLVNQYPQNDPATGEPLNSQYFHVIKYSHDARSMWGVPIIQGGDMISKIFIAMLVCVELQSLRFGNPPSMTIINPKDPRQFQGPADGGGTTLQAAFIKSIDHLQTLVNNAWALTFQGKRADVVAPIPGDVSITSKVMGEGFTAWIDPEVLWKVAILFASTLGVPPSMLNIQDTGAGIGSDRFRFDHRIMSKRMGIIRDKTRPHLRRIIQNYLLSMGVSPIEVDRIRIEFEETDMRDDKELAETRKLNAEADAIIIKNIMELDNFDPVQAQEYADRNGFEMEV